MQANIFFEKNVRVLSVPYALLKATKFPIQFFKQINNTRNITFRVRGEEDNFEITEEKNAGPYTLLKAHNALLLKIKLDLCVTFIV